MSLVKPATWKQQVNELIERAVAKAGSKRGLARVLGINYQTVIMWARGGEPKDHNIAKLEAYVRETP